jgi:hypothetical protein
MYHADYSFIRVYTKNIKNSIEIHYYAKMAHQVAIYIRIPPRGCEGDRGSGWGCGFAKQTSRGETP